MLMRAHHSETLALTLAEFTGEIGVQDLVGFQAAIAHSERRGRLSDEILVFDRDASFADFSMRAFRAHIGEIATERREMQMPISVRCALVSTVSDAKRMLKLWESAARAPGGFAPTFRLFESIDLAARWLGLNDAGVEMIRALKGFSSIYPEAPKPDDAR